MSHKDLHYSCVLLDFMLNWQYPTCQVDRNTTAQEYDAMSFKTIAFTALIALVTIAIAKKIPGLQDWV